MNVNRTNIRKKAVLLRKSGFTFRQISQKLNIPLGTSHLWTKQVRLTNKQLVKIRSDHTTKLQKGRQMAAVIQRQRSQVEEQVYKKLGTESISNLTNRELLITGAALYWAEGFKKDTRLGFANSDPKMIKLFLKWLFVIGKVPKAEIRLRVGVNQSYVNDIGRIQNQWSHITNIPLTQFQKPFFQKTKWKRIYKNPQNYLGVLRVRANKQKYVFHKILGMIDGLKKAA